MGISLTNSLVIGSIRLREDSDRGKGVQGHWGGVLINLLEGYLNFVWILIQTISDGIWYRLFLSGVCGS